MTVGLSGVLGPSWRAAVGTTIGYLVVLFAMTFFLFMLPFALFIAL
jgi:hypothetical protein